MILRKEEEQFTYNNKVKKQHLGIQNTLWAGMTSTCQLSSSSR